MLNNQFFLKKRLKERPFFAIWILKNLQHPRGKMSNIVYKDTKTYLDDFTKILPKTSHERSYFTLFFLLACPYFNVLYNKFILQKDWRRGHFLLSEYKKVFSFWGALPLRLPSGALPLRPTKGLLALGTQISSDWTSDCSHACFWPHAMS